jgi:hypothetical protein
MTLRSFYRLFLLFVVVCSVMTLVSAHKSASESAEMTSTHRYSFGLSPAAPYVGNEQEMFVTIRDVVTGMPSTDVDVELEIFKRHYHGQDVDDELVGTYNGEEHRPGDIVVVHTFHEKGDYILKASIMQGELVLTTLTKSMYVEPVGPSLMFWSYMLLALVVGILISLWSHRW